MNDTEHDPAYLATVIEAVVDAIAEASLLPASGDPAEVRELLRYANDLLDILTDGIHESTESFDCVARIRKAVLTMWSAASRVELH